MPKSLTHYKIFVSSPSNIKKEKQIIGEIFNELNKTWCEEKGIYLELLKWETDTYPDVGEYPQDVINRQIRQDYDIFVGILGQRFGSPTKMAGSGTEEEFNLAYERYKKDPKSIKIMFYFSNVRIPQSSIDPDQVKKINNFQEMLGEKGSLYWQYKSIKQFEQFFRMHISKRIIDWNKEAQKKEELMESDEAKINGKLEIVKEEKETHEEPGLLDLYESLNERTQVYMEIIKRMRQAINELSRRIKQRTKEILHVAQIKDTGLRLIKVREPINKVVEDLDLFNTRMEVEIPLFANTYNDLISYFTNTLLIQEDFNPVDKDEMQVVKNSLKLMLNTIRDSKNHTINMKDAVAEIPRMASNLNIAKRNTINILSELIKEMEKAEDLTIEAIKAISL